jgi:hypothetical protein
MKQQSIEPLRSIAAAPLPPRVVIKFRDEVNLPYEDGVERVLAQLHPELWGPFSVQFPSVTLTRVFTSLEPGQLRDLVDKARDRDKVYAASRHLPINLISYFQIDCPPMVDAETLIGAIMAWPIVETAYVQGTSVAPPSSVSPSDDPRYPNQRYLQAAPLGIDAAFAWGASTGTDGAGIHFIDLEHGWRLDHEDLRDAGITLLSGVNREFFGHGASVLGVVVGVDNTLGGVGIATRASTRVVSRWRTDTSDSIPDAILSAIAALDFGDVLLLEVQYSGLGIVEVEDATFAAIRLATALGIVVIEAAANSNQDLDTSAAGSGRFIFNRASLDFRDSGAIVVGACTAPMPHDRWEYSNYGSRIDCYAWGELIDTAGDDLLDTSLSGYTSDFGGTSGASAIIAGVALAVQGAAQAHLGYRFSPGQLRRLLSDPTTGTPSNDPATDRIGVMPNLRAILTSDVLRLSPDLYLRDFVGDTGDPHTSAASASPDVIVLGAPATDPQALFGQGSGAEDSVTLSEPVTLGHDHSVYVRVRNRGGIEAVAGIATVYWSPPATLVTPSLWHRIGTVALPTIPVGDVLTVSSVINWPAAEIPGAGHYCFVAVAGNDRDPAPTPDSLRDWDTFVRFVRANNNVAWRNFNVVDPAHPGGMGSAGGDGLPGGKAGAEKFLELPFLAPGAPDKDRRMRLEVTAQLGKDAQAWLALPFDLLDRLAEYPPLVKRDERLREGLVLLNGHGRTLIGEGIFPAKSESQLRLLITLPMASQPQPMEIAVQQFYEQDEVGRITWRLAAGDEAKKEMPPRQGCHPLRRLFRRRLS